MIRVALPYPISANRYWRSFPHPRMPKKVVTIVSDEAEAYKQHVGLALRCAGVRTPFLRRVFVGIELYPKRPKDWEKRKRLDPLYWDDTVARLDLDNCRKVLNDAMKDIAFGDDKVIVNDWGAVREPDGDARVIVTILPIVRAPAIERVLALLTE